MFKNFVFVLIFTCAFLAIGSCNHHSSAKKSKNDQFAVKRDTQIISTPVHNLTGKAKKLTDLAKFIAGLPIDTSNIMFKYSLTDAWKAYFKESTLVWNKFKKESDKILVWRDKELPSVDQPINTLFYPFGGPDYLFANLFFPNARNYILIGLESPGSAPQIDSSNKDSLSNILNLYKKAIEDVIQLSFFKTVDMKSDLTSKAIDGTAPIIMLFLARSGKEILDLNPMNISDDGKFVPASGKKKYVAVQIDFKDPGDSLIRHIYYLSTNLADQAVLNNKGVHAWLKTLDSNCTSMVKSATYLMHKSYFSIIRNTVLNHSTLILQDDSGIAYKFYDFSKWDIKLFGRYTKPIPMFSNHYEPDLFEAYKKVTNPIDFRFGYNIQSDILLAKKKL